METNNVTSTEDADMADCDGEKVVTMMDVLQEQEDFENDANAVLGASDEKNCTYTKGYIKRQAIYACMTCCAEAKTDPSKRAGVCLACSLTCHENHELIELYTKRNFRCDCGNPKFNLHTCQYSSPKTDFNENNVYNQNFSGLYCVCKRPYPDPENSNEDEMIQCIICEDWLHGSHLEATLPPNDQYSEMICKNCMEKNAFLHDYSNYAVNVKETDIDIMDDNTDISIINGDLNNETSKKIVATQKLPSKEEENITEPETSDPNASVKNADDTDAMPTDSNKSTKEQEFDSETTKNINENNCKTNEIDAESIEEDRLLADPEDGLEEHSKQEESVVKDDEKNKNTPEKDSKDVSDDVENIGDHKSTNNESIVDNETNDNKEISKNDNFEILKENVPDNPDGDKNTIAEQVETSKKTDKEEHSEIDNESSLEKVNDQNDTTDSKQNTETDNTENNENASKIEVQANLEETDVSEKTEDGYDSKMDFETKVEVSNKVQTSNNGTTNNNESNDSKTDFSECSDGTETQSNKDFTETNMKIDGDEKNLENADVEKKNDKDYNNENKRKFSTEENTSNVEDSGVSGKRIKLDSNCIRPKNVKRMYNGATFWPSDFRQKLCTCNECLTMYKDLSVLFLTDFEDTVRAYENLGEEKERIEGRPASQYERGLQALSSLDRIQQINALTEYNNMKDKLLEFLKSFKDRQEVVKEEDIKEFFAGMKPKREPDGVYFCR